MRKLLSARIFKDKGIIPFYWMTLGPGVLALILQIVVHEWGVAAMAAMIVLGFMYFGWPLSAELKEGGGILFKGMIRRVYVTPQSLAHMKVVGAHDFRAHITFRVKGDIPLGYRCRKYENRAILAQAMLDIIEKSPNARVTKGAIKLLRQTAKVTTKALPVK
jgi:hypothetical protein